MFSFLKRFFAKPVKCHYCDRKATKTLVWLYDKSHRPCRIRLPWCGCDLMAALRKIWARPYQIEEGIDYEIETEVVRK